MLFLASQPPWVFVQDEHDDAHDVEGIIKFSEEVADEDARVCEHVQRNLDAGHYNVGLLSLKWEYGVEVFHKLVRDAVGPVD